MTMHVAKQTFRQISKSTASTVFQLIYQFNSSVILRIIVGKK